MVIRVAAVSRRNAVPMPIGRILERLLGSLCNAMTYCAAKTVLVSVGMLLLANVLINSVNKGK